MAHWDLRARSVADRYGTFVVIGVVVIALLGGFLTFSAYGQTHTETEIVEETVSSWSSTGQFYHEAAVQEGSRAFPAGSTLSNRSVYFESIAPVLDGTFVYNYSASEGGSLSATTSVDLVVQSVRETERGNQTEIWQFEESIDDVETTLNPGESTRVTFSRNMSSLRQEIDDIESQLGGTDGTAEAVIDVTVDLEGTRNGVDVDQIRTYRLPVTFQGNQYHVNDSSPFVHHNERTVETEVISEVPAGPLFRLGGPLLLLFGIGGISAAIRGRKSGWFGISDSERKYLVYQEERTEFEDWITRARIPSDRIADANTRIETTSLSGLVDLAIDMDRRVIETPEKNCYVVLDDEVVYSFDPPSPMKSDVNKQSGGLADLEDKRPVAERSDKKKHDINTTSDGESELNTSDEDHSSRGQ